MTMYFTTIATQRRSVHVLLHPLRSGAACRGCHLNPTHYSYYAWAKSVGWQWRPPIVFVGVVLLIGWAICLRLTLRSIGGIGLLLANAFLAALFWLFADWGWLPIENVAAISWIGLFRGDRRNRSHAVDRRPDRRSGARASRRAGTARRRDRRHRNQGGAGGRAPAIARVAGLVRIQAAYAARPTSPSDVGSPSPRPADALTR